MKTKQLLLSLLITLASVVGATATDIPVGLAISEGFYPDRVVVRWTPVAGAQAYRVYRSTRPDPSFRVVLGVWQQGNLFEDRSAKAGVRYYYWVKAAASIAGTQASGFSAMDSGYLRVDQLKQPVALSTGSTESIELAWSEVLGALSYRVYRNTRPDAATATALDNWQTARKYTDLSAVPGVRYYYYIKPAHDSNGRREGVFSAPVSAYRGISPPESLAASGRLQGVSLSWDAVSGARLYQVWRSASTNRFSARALNDWQTDRTFIDADAQAGITYYYWVKAVGAQGVQASALGGMVSALRPLRQPLLRSIELGEGTVDIAWRMVEGGVFYRVYRSERPTAARAQVLGSWQRELRFVDVSAVPGRRYYYWVEAAVDAAGQHASGFAAALNGLLPLQVPAAPVVEEVEGNGVLLSWQRVEGGDYYRVYRAQRDDVGEAEALGSWQRELRFADAAARPGIRYYYWVEAAADATGRVRGGLSAASTRFLAMPSPEGISASQGLFSAQVAIEWQPVAGAEYYRVYRSETPQPAFRTVLGRWQRDTSFADGSVRPGIRYYYWIKAALSDQGKGAGAFSAVADGYLGGGVLLAPSGILASDGELVGQIEIAWNEVVGGRYYRVYRASSADTTGALPLGGWQTARTLIDRGVRPGQIYYYFVRSASDQQGRLASTLGVANSGYRALATPGNLLVSAGLATTVELQWSPVAGANFYRVYRSRNDQAADARPLGTWQGATSLVDAAAIPGATYYYWVKAATSRVGLNASNFGNVSSGFRSLSTPAQLAVAAERTTGVSLQWPTVLGASYYQVLRSERADVASAQPLSDWLSSAQYEDVTAAPGVTYYYFVRAAVDGAGARNSGPSAVASGFRPLYPPQALVLNADGAGLSLQWNAVSGANYYQVLRSERASFAAAKPLASWLSSAQYEDMTAVPGVTYYYFVRAAAGANGYRSSAASAVSGYRNFAVIQAFTVQGGDPDRVLLQWQAVEDAAAYRVYRSERPDAERAGPLSNWQPDTQFVDDSARPGVIYYYYARAAADLAGYNPGPLTSVQSAYRALRGPSLLGASRNEIGEVALQWTGVDGASFYRVYRSTSNDAALAQPLAGWQTEISYVDATADPGVEYRYFIRAATSSLGHRASPFGSSGLGVRRLPPPETLLGSTGDTDRVRIAWTPVVGATHYQVYRTRDLESVLVHPVSTWLQEAFYDDVDTEPGVEYHYFVRAASGPAGEAASGFSSEVVAYRGLQAPVQVQVTLGDLDAVHLQWPAIIGARYYQVYRGIDGDVLNAVVLGVWATATRSVDSTATPGEQWSYFVRAATDAQGGNASALSAVANGYRGLLAPADLRASTGESGQVNLSWASVEGATHYRAFRGLTDDFSLAQALGTDWQVSTSFVDANVDSGVTYHYFARAASDVLASIVSAQSASARGYAQVGAPSDFQVLPDGGRILLRWQANREFDVSSYRIYAGFHPDSTAFISTVASSPFPQLNIASVLPLPERFNLVDLGLNLLASRAVIASEFARSFARAPLAAEVDVLFSGGRLERDEIAPLDRERSYYFRVSAVNAGGYESVVTTGRVFSASSVPVEVKGGVSAVEVSWVPVWGADYYRVYRHTSADAALAEPLGPWQQGSQVRDISAVPGVLYHYFVRTARSASGEGASEFSEGASGYRRLAAPAVVASTRDLEDRVQLTWITVAGAGVYRVLHSTENDIEAAQPLGPWQEDVNFEHLQAAPGDNFYWVQAATDADGAFAGPLSVVSPGRRISSLVVPTVLEASWGEFKDKVQIMWQREAAAKFVRLYRGSSVDAQAAQAISNWVEWNGFEDRTATADQTYYYFVQVASSADGAHASGLSAGVRGFRSGSVTVPKGLKTTTTPGKIFLSWEPNPRDEDLMHYRVYGGTEPEALTLIDSVRADEDPRAVIRDIIPLPKAFNVVDMGLDISADREVIRTRFVGYFNMEPRVEWLDELFAGRRLDKSDIIVLEVGRTYYFQVAAVNDEREASRMSSPTQVLVTQAVAGKVVRAFGDQNVETGIQANAPNPFNSSTLLRFALAEDADVTLRVYDTLGQVVRQIANGHFAAGRYAVSWDARNEGGYAVGSGVYFYMMEVSGRTYPGRMLLLR